MRVRIIKALPAPLMDGFDVGRLRVNRVYNVENRLANYLIVAGYGAVESSRDARDRTKRQRGSSSK